MNSDQEPNNQKKPEHDAPVNPASTSTHPAQPEESAAVGPMVTELPHVDPSRESASIEDQTEMIDLEDIGGGDPGNEQKDGDDPKRTKRILANRQSAARSRERKLEYVEKLETQVKNLEYDVERKKIEVSTKKWTNRMLREENAYLLAREGALLEGYYQANAVHADLRAQKNLLELTLQLQQNAQNPPHPDQPLAINQHQTPAIHQQQPDAFAMSLLDQTPAILQQQPDAFAMSLLDQTPDAYQQQLDDAIAMSFLNETPDIDQQQLDDVIAMSFLDQTPDIDQQKLDDAIAMSFLDQTPDIDQQQQYPSAMLAQQTQTNQLGHQQLHQNFQPRAGGESSSGSGAGDNATAKTLPREGENVSEEEHP